MITVFGSLHFFRDYHRCAPLAGHIRFSRPQLHVGYCEKSVEKRPKKKDDSLSPNHASEAFMSTDMSGRPLLWRRFRALRRRVIFMICFLLANSIQEEGICLDKGPCGFGRQLWLELGF